MKHILDRGIATVVVSAALTVGFASCSSEPIAESKGDESPDAGQASLNADSTAHRDVVLASDRARAILLDWQNLFVKQPPRPERERVALPGEPEPVGIRPVIRDGVATEFVRSEARLKPIIEH